MVPRNLGGGHPYGRTPTLLQWPQAEVNPVDLERSKAQRTAFGRTRGPRRRRSNAASPSALRTTTSPSIRIVSRSVV